MISSFGYKSRMIKKKKKYVKDLQDQEEIIDVMSLYILEKETLGENNWAQKGKELLSSMVE